MCVNKVRSGVFPPVMVRILPAEISLADSPHLEGCMYLLWVVEGEKEGPAADWGIWFLSLWQGCGSHVDSMVGKQQVRRERAGPCSSKQNQLCHSFQLHIAKDPERTL